LKPVEQFERRFLRPAKGRTLIVGSKIFSQREDRRQLYPNAVGVDLCDGEGVDAVADCETDALLRLGKFRHVECLSVLEHARRPWLIAANIERVLEPGGSVYISVPAIWRRHDYGGDRWRILPDAVRDLFPAIEWKAINIATERELMPENFKKLPSQVVDGQTFIARCETFAFGYKPA
jgi:SAM-dependent methyltransferase